MAPAGNAGAPLTARCALVTGASSGIGLALAEELAGEGWNLVITARRGDRLRRFAEEHGSRIRVETFEADLADAAAPRRIFEFTEGLGIAVGLLANNAGFGDYGELRSLDPDRQLAMIQVNCAAVVGLTSVYLPGMIARGAGDILIVASTASFQAVPYQSTYAATKAFDLIFAEGVAEEVKRFGVRVCALCPGQTASEFHAVAREPIPAGMSVQSAREVARIGLKGLRAGKHCVVGGFANRMGMEIQRMLPRRVVTAVSERLFRPKGI